MAQDIVDILRDRHAQYSSGNQTILSESADEIERLRAEIERLQAELRRIETVASNYV